MDLLELATLFRLYVVNNIPLVFVQSGVLPFVGVQDVARYEAIAKIS